MPTTPILASVSGASFSVNTTGAELDTTLTVRDFLVLENGTLTLNPLSYTKTGANSITYSGPALPVTTLEIRRNTPRAQRTVALPGTKVRSIDWNLEFDRRVRIQEEIDLYGAGGGFNVRLPVNAPYSIAWQADTLFSPTRQALYNQMQLYAPLTSPVFTGNPTGPTPLTSDNSASLATTAYVRSNLGLLAPLASPAFTGTPTVPTALTADNTQTIASTQHVKNNLALYLPLAGGTLTGNINGTTATFSGALTGATATFSGNVTVPTQVTTDNSTLVATTAHVKSNLALYAPLASPVFTGTPTMPLAANGTNTLQGANMQAMQRRSQPIVIARRTTTLALANNTFTDVVYDTVVTATAGVYNNTTGVFTAPYTGVYVFNGMVTTNASTAVVLALVQTTGTELCRISQSFQPTAGLLSASGSVVELLNAGDTRKFNAFSSGATTTLADTARNFNHMSIYYLGIA